MKVGSGILEMKKGATANIFRSSSLGVCTIIMYINLR